MRADIITIEEARVLVSDIQHTLNWLHRTGRLSQIEIPNYDQFTKRWDRLLKGLKIDLEGNLLSQDKRGYWSVRKK
jgi:hypothetical protein